MSKFIESFDTNQSSSVEWNEVLGPIVAILAISILPYLLNRLIWGKHVSVPPGQDFSLKF